MNLNKIYSIIMFPFLQTCDLYSYCCFNETLKLRKQQSFESMNSQYASTNKLLEACSKNAFELVNLLEGMAISEKGHLRSDLLLKVFNKINILESNGKLNEIQAQKVISIISKIYPKIYDKQLKTTICNFSFNHITNENVYTVLKLAKLENNFECIRNCLNNIENQLSIKIYTNTYPISIEICSPKVSYDKLSITLSALINIFENQVEIKINPQDTGDSDHDNLSNFLKIHGKYVKILDLRDLAIYESYFWNNEITDKFLDVAIKSCPNLNCLKIYSAKIYGGCFRELEHLKYLTILELECKNLEKLPTLPVGLTTLELIDCKNIKKLPKLPVGLIKLDLYKCESLTEEYRISVLSKLIAENFEQAIQLFSGFYIKNPDTLFQLIIGKISGTPILEGQNSISILVDILEKKISSQTISPSDLNLLSEFIFENQELLRLHQEHPLMQAALEIRSAASIEGGKNPFSLFKELKKLFQQNSDFSPPSIEIDDISVAINMDQLKILSQGTKISREDLLTTVTREVFDRFVLALKLKVESNKEISLQALNELGTTWATISVPIFEDSKQHLSGLLDLKGENVSEVEAKWRAVLANVFDKSPNQKENSFFSEQEEVFILTMMGIQNCEGGKDMGIALSYELLDTKYHYKITLSKPVSNEDLKMRNNALTFVKNFIIQQKKLFGMITFEKVAENLKKSIDEDLRQNSAIIFPLVEDIDESIVDMNANRFKYWDVDDSGDMKLNMSGAQRLLIVTQIDDEAEKKQLLMEQFIAEVIKKLIAAQFTGTNPLMQELTGVEQDQIRQGAHQAIYLKNLIGYLVGVSSGVVFDRHTGVLYDNLIERSRDEILKIFFTFVTPESLVNEIIKAVNEKPEESKQLFTELLSVEFWKCREDASLTPKGAVALLEKFGYLKRKEKFDS